MAKFTAEITDPAHLAGITAKREKHNSGLPAEHDSEGKTMPVESHSQYVATDQDFMQMVMANAAATYAEQHGLTADHISKLEAMLADAKRRMKM